MGEKRFDLKFNYHYTTQCDMKCSYCFKPSDGDLDESLIISTFKNICKVTSKVNLVGGEVFLDVELLYKLVRLGVENGTEISIVTNGLILSKILDNWKIKYIIKNITLLGISVDSFSVRKNLSIKRCNIKKETLDFQKVVDISKLCSELGTPIKINTVVSKINLNEIFMEKIQTINPLKWKLLQVVTDDEEVAISQKELQQFAVSNFVEKIDIRVEDTKLLTNSYIICNSRGTIFHNQKFYQEHNINSVVDEDDSSLMMKKFKDILIGIGFDLSLYNKRYS
ncbi:radical SAM protein [Mycoplasmatota bacterium WC44]